MGLKIAYFRLQQLGLLATWALTLTHILTLMVMKQQVLQDNGMRRRAHRLNRDLHLVCLLLDHDLIHRPVLLRGRTARSPAQI